MPALLWCSAWPWLCDSGSWSLPQRQLFVYPFDPGNDGLKSRETRGSSPSSKHKTLGCFPFLLQIQCVFISKSPLVGRRLLFAASLHFSFVCYRIREQKNAFLFSISLFNHQVLNAVQIELALLVESSVLFHWDRNLEGETSVRVFRPPKISEGVDVWVWIFLVTAFLSCSLIPPHSTCCLWDAHLFLHALF